MLNSAVRILDFDGSLTRQKELLEKFNPEITDFRDIGRLSRMWIDRRIAQEIRKRINPASKNTLTFTGSGDFHHISALLIGQFTEPLSVIIFDHHPDWDIMPPRFACGSWVSFILRQPNVKNVVLLGVSSDDISDDSIFNANLAALKDNRVQIYPYWHEPTKVLLKSVPWNKSVSVRRGLFSSTIHWQELRQKCLPDFLHHIISGLDSRKVYVSIDKDCLNCRAALTNWEEGNFSLEDLLELIKVIKERADILGFDVTGEYSPVDCAGRIKSFVAELDHPKYYTAKGKDPAVIDALNQRTNTAIIEALFS